MKIKYCALAISAVLMGCNDDSSAPTPDESYQSPIAGNVAISGSPVVDGVLTGEYTFLDPSLTPRPEGVSVFEWHSTETRALLGSEKAYTVAASDSGKRIYFCVTPKAQGDENNVGERKCSDSVEIEATTLKPVAENVSISGETISGSTLTGAYTIVDQNDPARPAGASTYQWNDNGTEIGTEKAFTLTDSEVGKQIEFCVTPVVEGDENTIGNPVCVTSGEIKPNLGSAPVASELTINGADAGTVTPTVGERLTADFVYFDADSDPEGSHGYQWKANNVVIAGQTSETFLLTKEQEGKQIEFCVTPQSTNPDDLSDYPTVGAPECSGQTVAVMANSGSAPTAAPVTMTGDAIVGQTLSGEYGYQDADGDTEGQSVLSWQRGGVDIADQTGVTYALTSADLGQEVAFCVKPVALTGLEKEGSVTCATAETVEASTTPIPTVTVSNVTAPELPKVGSDISASYTYESSASDADASSVYWKIGSNKQDCGTGADSECTLTIEDAHLGEDIRYCVTPKSATSAEGAEQCTNPVTTYGLKLAGELELYKTLTPTAIGYTNVSYVWDIVDRGTDTGETKSTSNTYVIGEEIHTAISAEFEEITGNNNGIIDDADWNQALKAGEVDALTPNAAHYVGHDVKFCMTSTEENICVKASEVDTVTGGMIYDKADLTKRAIEPVRQVAFNGLMYHRPLTAAETMSDVFGANLPAPNYTKLALGIEWASYKLINNAEKPALSACLNLYDNDQWALPISRSDSSYTANDFEADGNNAPSVGNTATLIKLPNIDSNGSAGFGLIGLVKTRTTADDVVSATFGWPTGLDLEGDNKHTPYWSATKYIGDANGNYSSIKFYDNGGSGNNSSGNGRFVSCVNVTPL